MQNNPVRLKVSYNRWVKPAEAMPWEELSGVYNQALSKETGRPALSARTVVGALTVKHMLPRDIFCPCAHRVQIKSFSALFSSLMPIAGQPRFQNVW